MMCKESKARYEHYKANLYRQTMDSVHNYRAKMYYGMPLHEVPSILDSTIAAERKARKDARAMVKEDKRLAKLNKMKLKDFPRTEWALSLEDYEQEARRD